MILQLDASPVYLFFTNFPETVYGNCQVPTVGGNCITEMIDSTCAVVYLENK